VASSAAAVTIITRWLWAHCALVHPLEFSVSLSDHKLVYKKRGFHMLSSLHSFTPHHPEFNNSFPLQKSFFFFLTMRISGEQSDDLCLLAVLLKS
jgi:hypothetical protein